MLSPGGRLVFNSDRWGSYEIHTADAGGLKQVALTAMGPTAMGSPRWSPDGQMVVFDRYENGHSMIYTVGAEGGKPRLITGDAFRDIRPAFSRDGKWIYFASNRSGRLEIWKVPSGGGTVQQVTRNSGNEPFESPDGKLLYYQNDEGLWSLSLATGEPRLVLTDAGKYMYAPAGRSIYYVRNGQSLWVYRLDTGRKFEYLQFPKSLIGPDLGTLFTVQKTSASSCSRGPTVTRATSCWLRISNSFIY